MERSKARAPGIKSRPTLLTDPPIKSESRMGLTPTPMYGAFATDRDDSTQSEAESTRPDKPTTSYSARARESMATAATSRRTATLTRTSEGTSSDNAFSVCTSPTWEIHDRHRATKRDAAEKSNRPRLVKPPPSASRTPKLWAKNPAPLQSPPTDHQRFESFGPPPQPPPRDEKISRSRKRSDSLGSISSVSSSLTSKIFDIVPRGRSTTRETGTSFLNGIKPRRQKEAEYEWHGRRLAAHNPTSYSLPAHHMYRQPGGSGLSRQYSRSSSHSVASSDNFANPPPLSFPSNQRHRGPPVALRTPAPISRSRSGSRSESPAACVQDQGSRRSSQGPPISRNSSRDEPNIQMTEKTIVSFREDSNSGWRRSNSLPSQSRDPLGDYYMTGADPGFTSGLHGKEYPPSASASAFAYLANLSDESAEPPRSRRSSFIGRLRARSRVGSQDAQDSSDSPSEYSEDMPRARSTTRNLRDAAKAAFRRSTSVASSFRRRSETSDRSSGETATKDMTSPFSEVGSANTVSNPASPTRSAIPVSTGPVSILGSGSGPWNGRHPSKDASEALRRPPPMADPHSIRAWDHSSISSYDTSQSRHQSSNLTPNTSRPQSEKGLHNTVGVGDSQKVLGGSDKPSLASSASPGAGVATQMSDTPPVRKKSSRRALRVRVGAETSPSSPKSPKLPVTPTMSSSSTTPTFSAAVKGVKTGIEWETKPNKNDLAAELDETGTRCTSPPRPSRGPGSPVDLSMLPKPLNLSPQTSESMESVIPHKLRRRAKSQRLLSDDTTSGNSAQGSDEAPSSQASSPRERQVHSVAPDETLSAGDAPVPVVKNPWQAKRHERDTSKSSFETGIFSKILVRCCGCGYFHDLPPRIYGRITAGLEDTREAKEEKSGEKEKHVRCPWCRHLMSVRCCAGYVAAVQLKERLH